MTKSAKIGLVIQKKLLALFLGLILLLSSSGLIFLAGPGVVSASPEVMEWSVVDTPSEEGNVVVDPSEINSFVIGSDGETFYAIDIPDGEVYKSTNAGVTWENVTAALDDEGAALPAWDIAVAPGNPDVVAVVTDDRTAVYVSEDGGKIWSDTHISDFVDWSSGALIADIAISPEYSGHKPDIAVGTRNPDDGTSGNVWVVQWHFGSNWKSQGLNLDVTSVHFSPDYASDETILAVASDNSTYLCTGYRNTNTNTTEWDVTDPSRVEISEIIGNSPGRNEIIFSDLSLPSNYSGDKAKSRVVYAAYSSNTTADDVYRIEDTKVNRLDIKNGNKVSISSIAYYGTYSGGKLLAGEVEANVNTASAFIHVCWDPEENRPDWQEPTKPPTGGAITGRANAQVAWSLGGKSAYCGTSSNNVTSAANWREPDEWTGQVHDETAFSRSDDAIYQIWNQLSLIDTEMSYLCDYALSAEHTTLYLASTGGGFDSIWRSRSDPLGGIWQRVLCFDGETDNVILRSDTGSSEEEIIFFAVLDSYDARYSWDKGQTWKRMWDCSDITDMAVVSSELMYILEDNLVNKGTWRQRGIRGIWEWEKDIDTGLLSGYSITASGKKFVFVGEDEDGEGRVAYSVDGGVTFELTTALPEPGNVVVIPDHDFIINRLIYAASDSSGSGIYRWTIEGSNSWQELNPPHSHLGFCGLAEKRGTLYGAYGPGVDRTLIPRQENVRISDWDSLTLGLCCGANFKPGTLRAMTDDDVELWAIDKQAYDFPDDKGCLWVFSDSFTLASPWPTSPAIGEFLYCDTCTCSAKTFTFHWRELPLAGKYDLWIAIDEEFEYVIAKVEDIAPTNLHNPSWCSLEIPLRFVCGNTYFWRVRSCERVRSSETMEVERVRSRWSPPIRFAVKTCSTDESMHSAPILIAPESDSKGVSRSPGFSWQGFTATTKYEFILAADAYLDQVLVKQEVPVSAYVYSRELDWGTTYFWQVKAVEPVPSEPSTVGIFTVIPKKAEPAPPAVPPPAPQAQTPFWVWLVVGILAFLSIVAIIVLLLVRR